MAVSADEGGDMGSEENKEIVRFILDNYEQEDMRIAKHFANEFFWEGHQIDYSVSPWIGQVASPIDIETWMVGQRAYAQMFAADGTRNRLEREYRSITAEGDRVVAEYVTRGTMAVGVDVTNKIDLRVVKIFEFADGKVVRIREYCDTGHLAANGRAFGAELKKVEETSGFEVVNQ